MTSTTFKELKDGRYRLRLPPDILHILRSTLAKIAQYPYLPVYEHCLIQETAQALQKGEIKLRKSEFFFLFSSNVQIHVEEGTQRYIKALLNVDEIRRKAMDPAKRYPTGLPMSFKTFKS